MQDKNTEKRTEEGLFLDRIKKIAGDRKLTPWLTSLGWIANDVTRIKSGVVPGSTKLQQVALAENVNLNWLLTGVGQRHVVEHWLSDHAVAGRVADLLFRSSNGRVISAYEPRSKRALLIISALKLGADHECFAILVGPLGDLTYAALDRLSMHLAERALIELSPEIYAAIAEGRVMRSELIDPVAGIQLLEGTRMNPYNARESMPLYLSVRDRLHLSIDGLSDERAQSLLTLLEGTE